MEEKLQEVIKRVSQETGLRPQAIRFIYGAFDGQFEWCVESLMGIMQDTKRRRPPMSGFGPTPDAAADDYLDVYRRWLDPTIAAKEAQQLMLDELRGK